MDIKQTTTKEGGLAYYYSVARFAFIIVLVVALGVFTINQILAYRYKAEFLKTPCALCADLNPKVSECVEGCFTIRKELYPDGFGSWRDSEGKCFNAVGLEMNCTNTFKNNLNNEMNLSLNLG